MQSFVCGFAQIALLNAQVRGLSDQLGMLGKTDLDLVGDPGVASPSVRPACVPARLHFSSNPFLQRRRALPYRFHQSKRGKDRLGLGELELHARTAYMRACLHFRLSIHFSAEECPALCKAKQKLAAPVRQFGPALGVCQAHSKLFVCCLFVRSIE
jgi:hypothetical protein